VPTLTLRVAPKIPLDLSPLLPGRLAGGSESALAALPLRLGNREVPLGELFGVAADGDDRLVLAGTNACCDRIGAGMASGRLVVEGDAGTGIGLAMSGGDIEVRGSVGPMAGAEATGGVLRIAGNAGERLGGALPGAGGMSGGTILLGGNCGARVGERMRKGLIVVDGDAGIHAAVAMRGGTVVVRGACGPDPAPLMRRGTLYLARRPARLLPTFADDGEHELLWLRLLERHLAGLQAPALTARRVRRWSGDLADIGKGEVLVAIG
jgi:formylmethanofuran dehydrogenase subunit C